MLQRRRYRCILCIFILVIGTSIFYYFPLSTLDDYVDINKYPDFRKYAKNVGDKLGLEKALSSINGEGRTDLNDVPLRLLMSNNIEVPKKYLQNTDGNTFRKKADEGAFDAPKLVVVSGQRHNQLEIRPPADTLLNRVEGAVDDTDIQGAVEDLAVLEVKKSAEPNVKFAKESKHFDAQEELDKQAILEKESHIRNRTREAPVSLIIVTNRRSGSSFLGQIFNQNPNVFFHFEPLKVMEWKKELYPNGSKLICNIFKCRFDATPFLLEMYNHEILHRESSRVLMTPPLCNLTQIVNRLKPVNFCPQLRTDIAMDVCKRYNHVAIKTIRMYSLSSLEEVVRDSTLNIKIIHLMRDPRGIYISRTKAEKKALSLGTNLDQEVRYICRRMRKNLEIVKGAPAWLEGRYIRVRYEDVAEDPMGWTEKLYNFTGIGKVPKEVLKWIRENTKGSSDSNAYSTHRNSASTSQAWRKAASVDVVQRMQSLCHEVLIELGYLEVNGIEQLRNESLSLVV